MLFTSFHPQTIKFLSIVVVVIVTVNVISMDINQLPPTNFDDVKQYPPTNNEKKISFVDSTYLSFKKKTKLLNSQRNYRTMFKGFLSFFLHLIQNSSNSTWQTFLLFQKIIVSLILIYVNLLCRIIVSKQVPLMLFEMISL